LDEREKESFFSLDPLPCGQPLLRTFHLRARFTLFEGGPGRRRLLLKAFQNGLAGGKPPIVSLGTFPQWFSPPYREEISTGFAPLTAMRRKEVLDSLISTIFERPIARCTSTTPSTVSPLHIFPVRRRFWSRLPQSFLKCSFPPEWRVPHPFLRGFCKSKEGGNLEVRGNSSIAI